MKSLKQNRLLTKNAKLFLCFIVTCLFVTTVPVEVQATLSELGKNVSDGEIPQFVTILSKCLAFVGLCLVAGGVFGWLGRKQTNMTMGQCASLAGGGFVLMGLTEFAGHGVSSIFGSDYNDSGLKQIMDSSS